MPIPARNTDFDLFESALDEVYGESNEPISSDLQTPVPDQDLFNSALDEVYGPSAQPPPAGTTSPGLSAEGPLSERGIIGEVGAALGTGIVGTAEMYARAARVLGFDTTEIIERSKKSAEPLQASKDGYFWDSVNQGIASTIQSVLGGMPGAAVGLVGGPVGSVGGFAASAGTLFSLAEYDRFMDDVKSAGLNPADFKDNAIISALAEGGIEAATDLIGAKIFKIAGGKIVDKTIKAAFKRLTGQTLKFAAVEVPGEMATSAIQASQMQEPMAAAGLESTSPWDAAIASAGPAGVQTLLMGPLAGGLKTQIQKPGAGGVEGEIPPAPTSEEIRTGFKSGEHSKEDLEAMKFAWPEPDVIKVVDELLGTKPAEEPKAEPVDEETATKEQERVDMEADIIEQRAAVGTPEDQVKKFVQRVSQGEKLDTPTDIQFYEDNKTAIEAGLLKKLREARRFGKDKVKTAAEKRQTQIDAMGEDIAGPAAEDRQAFIDREKEIDRKAEEGPERENLEAQRLREYLHKYFGPRPTVYEDRIKSEETAEQQAKQTGITEEPKAKPAPQEVRAREDEDFKAWEKAAESRGYTPAEIQESKDFVESEREEADLKDWRQKAQEAETPAAERPKFSVAPIGNKFAIVDSQGRPMRAKQTVMKPGAKPGRIVTFNSQAAAEKAIPSKTETPATPVFIKSGASFSTVGGVDIGDTKTVLNRETMMELKESGWTWKNATLEQQPGGTLANPMWRIMDAGEGAKRPLILIPPAEEVYTIRNGKAAAADVNKKYPGYKITFDGVQEGFDTIPDTYQFTIYEGPAKGATFNAKDLDTDTIKARIDDMVAMRKPATDKIKGGDEGDLITKKRYIRIKAGAGGLKVDALLGDIDESKLFISGYEVDMEGVRIKPKGKADERQRVIQKSTINSIEEMRMSRKYGKLKPYTFKLETKRPAVDESLLSTKDFDKKTQQEKDAVSRQALNITIANLEAKLENVLGPRGGRNAISDKIEKELGRAKAMLYRMIGPKSTATTHLPSLSTLKLSDIKSLAFTKHGTVLQHDDGTFSVSFPNSRGFYVQSVDSIKDGEILLKAAYGRPKGKLEKISGMYEHDNKTVSIVKGVGDKWTVGHEFQHFLEQSGLLTKDEIDAIDRQAEAFNKGKYTGEEGRARWVAHELEVREKARASTIGKIIQKIEDIIDGFVNLFKQTSGAAVRTIESGKAVTREAQIEKPGEVVPTFATQESKPTLSATQKAYLEKHYPKKLDESNRTLLKKELGTPDAKDPHAQTASWEKDLFGTENKTLVDKVSDGIKDFWANRYTRTFDRTLPIKTLLGDETYMLKRLETGTQGVVAAFMRHGNLRWDGKAMTIDTRNAGFLEWYKGLGKDGKNLLYWIAAKRAEILESEGREQWLTAAERKRIFDGIGAKPISAEAWDDLNTKFMSYHNGILDLAEKAGLIDPAKRVEWAQDYYIPFWRVFEDPDTREEYLRGPHQARRTIDAMIRHLKGADMKLGDPLENVIKNWMHLISESMRNVSMKEAWASAQKLDSKVLTPVEKSELTKILNTKNTTRWAAIRSNAQKAARTFDTREEAQAWASDRKGYSVIPEKSRMTLFGLLRDNNILAFQDNGKRVYVRVNDPELFNAMSNVNAEQFDNVIMRMFRLSKKFLTYGATFGPAFRVANLIRDTLHTALISKNFIPLVDSMKGFAKAWYEDQDMVRLQASGAAFGSSYVRADDAEALAKYIDKITKHEGKSAIDRILDNPRKLLAIWERIGSASENAARVALYSKRIKDQQSHLESAFEARDLLDFTMRGDAKAVQFLIQMIPFMNARMQGLYKLGRAGWDVPTEDKLFHWKYVPETSFAVKGGMVAAASLLLWTFNQDRDEWKELEDWDKWTYYHFWIGDQHYRIPKPFEVGAIFSSLFESAAETIYKNEDLGFFTDFIKFMFVDTFSINPFPQLIRPALEQWANKSFFTGRPIESEHLQGLTAEARYDAWTSKTLQLAGKWGIPPKRAEALIEGYFATLGTFMLGIADSITYRIADFPENPSREVRDYPFIGRFVRGSTEPRTTKYVSRFYDTMKEIDQLVGTVNMYKTTGNMKAAREVVMGNRDLMAIHKPLNTVRTSLREVNANIRKTYDSSLSPDDKRDRLNKLTQIRNEKVKQAYKIIENSKKLGSKQSQPAGQFGPKPPALKL